jgi:CHAT domain-containing protein
MMRHLNELQPTIVHFSGHGVAGADGSAGAAGCRQALARRNIAVSGIQLQDEHRQPQHVDGHALARMIRSAAPSARVIVLNACFGSDLAEALLSVVDCVVGMIGAVSDDAARSFAISFYRALGNRSSIGNAVEQASATLAAKHVPIDSHPVSRTREGVRADQLFLPPLEVHRA